MEETTKPAQDRLDPARAAAYWQVLGRDGPPPGMNDPAPALFHQIYFWAVDAAAHRGVLAGGRLSVHTPLRLGILAERGATMTPRAGGHGACLHHTIRQRGALVLTYEMDFFAPDAAPPAMAQNTVRQASDRCALRFSDRDLFYHAALTMDPSLWCDTPKSPDQTHQIPGSLLATALAGYAEAHLGPLSSFQFRIHGSVASGEACQMCRDRADCWIEHPDGSLVMTAMAG